MNKGNNNHYSLLLQDETETDGICLEEEEEEEVEADMHVIGEEEDDDDDDDDDDEEPVEDSDEEEIFSSSKHRTLSHEGANLNGQNHLGGHGNEYRLLNNNDADIKAVIDTPITIWTPTPMSPARRACFIASIMFGVLMVATFLWVLPCDVQPCEGDINWSDKEWAVRIEGMGINRTKLVRRLNGGHNVLLSYYTSTNITGWQTENSTASDDEDVWKVDHLSPGCNNCGEGDDSMNDPADIIGDGQCGLLMLDGNLGRENWRIRLRECPVDIQCDLLDVTGDRVPDCMVRGSHSMVIMIEARYGTIMWYLHRHKEAEEKSQADVVHMHNTEPPAKLLKPGSAIVLPDVNNDTFGDLLMSGLLTQSPNPWNSEYAESEFKPHTPINNLVLVCGQSGSILGAPYVLEKCQRVLSLSIEGQLVHYTCLELEGERIPTTIHLKVLLNKILGNSASVEESQVYDNSYTLQYTGHSRKRDACKVKFLSNSSTCPKCQSKIVFSRGNGSDRWIREYEHSSVVSWADLVSNGECHGAIFKIWEYKHITTVVKAAKASSWANRRTTRSSLMNEDESPYSELIEEEKEDNEHATVTTNGNYSDSKEIHTLLHKSSLADLKEEYSGSAKDLNTQSTTTLKSVEGYRQRREFQEEASEDTEVYEHPTIHRHRGKQTSGAHNGHSGPSEKDSEAWESSKEVGLHPKQVSTTASVPRGMRTMPPDVLAPPGYQLQHIHEKIFVLKFNGSNWVEETLRGMRIIQLCQDEKNCIPDMKSHCKSVAVNPGVKENTWQLVTTSTTFVNTPTHGEEQHSAPWTLTSILRKIIVVV